MRFVFLLFILLAFTSPVHAALTVLQPPPASVVIGVPFTVIQHVTGPATLPLGIANPDGCYCFAFVNVGISPPDLAPAPFEPGGDVFWTSVDIPDGVTATYSMTLEAQELGAQRLVINGITYTIIVTRPAQPPPLRRTWLPLVRSG